MQLTDYQYELPEQVIAIHPPKVRGSTRLLCLGRTDGVITDGQYSQLADYLNPGDILVINNTKVLPARLLAKTEDDSERELLLLEKHGKQDSHFSSLVMYRRKLRPGQQLMVDGTPVNIDQVFDDGTAQISSKTDLWELAEKSGEVPLPPYMHRREEPEDRARYQTEFAAEKGSVAAPTASLNLTNQLLEKVQAKGIEVVQLTLHVGLGTFMPIRVDDLTKHKMHQEYFEIPAATAMAIQKAKREGRRVIAVGTTVTRTLEYSAQQIIEYSEGTISGEADIFIYPGYDFKIIGGLLTNFHAPRSTVLMMTAAFAGWDKLLPAYNHAVNSGYKLLSYGDSTLIL